MDQILNYVWDNQLELETTSTHTTTLTFGAKPKRLRIHPWQPFAYIINVLDGTITIFVYNATSGKLTKQQTVST